MLARDAAPTLEIHIPISPTPSFFTMIRYFAATLRRNGGQFAGASLVVSVGDDCEPFDINAAYPELAQYRIAWRWVDREQFRQHSYFATGLDRWADPFKADYVLMADADLLVTGDFSNVIEKIPQPCGIAGVIATLPQFWATGLGNVDRARWAELFQLAGLGEISLDCRHLGIDIFYTANDAIAEAPPVYNFAFVLGTRDAMNSIRKSFEMDYLLAKDYMKTVVAAQVALCLSIVRNKIPYTCLPPSYNFWSHELYLRHFPQDAKEMKIFHYLNPPFRKHIDTISHSSINERLFACRDDNSLLIRFASQTFESAYKIVSEDIKKPTVV
jgi:lipopolysaccharide biosynthesis glycosyltransferase